MSGRLFSFVIGLALVVSLILVACAPAAAPSPTQGTSATKPSTQEPAAKPTAAQAPAQKPAVQTPGAKAPAPQPAALRKVTLYTPIPVKTIAMFQAVIPDELGYYKEEGLEVNVEAVDGSPFIVQQMAGGKGEAGLVTAGTVMGAWAEGHKSKAVWELQTEPVFRLVVPEDSPIKKVKDLEGKVIGVKVLQGGDIAELKAELAKSNLTVGKNVQLQPLGEDMGPAWQALKGGKVAAFNAAIPDVTNLFKFGANLRIINDPVDPDKLMPQVPLIVRSDIYEKEPKVAIGLARAMSKAIVFAKENPDAALAIMKKAFPPEHTDTNFTHRYLQRTVESMWPQPGRLFGQMSMEGAKTYQSMLINPGAPTGLQKAFDLTPFITNDLIKEINNFDVEKVKKDARESKLKYP